MIYYLLPVCTVRTTNDTLLLLHRQRPTISKKQGGNRFGHAVMHHAPNQLKMSHGHFSHYSSTDTTAELCFDAEINIFFYLDMNRVLCYMSKSRFRKKTTQHMLLLRWKKHIYTKRSLVDY